MGEVLAFLFFGGLSLGILLALGLGIFHLWLEAMKEYNNYKNNYVNRGRR
jgi:hypothetical protein